MTIGALGTAGAGEGRPVLIVTGLAQEARIAAGPGMSVICSSSNPHQLRSILSDFDHSSIRGIISFGVAGGLDPMLRSGDIVVATEVVSGDQRWQAETGFTGDLITNADLGRRQVARGILAGVEEVVVGPKGKAALRARTGAAAVDMESHIAAHYAVDKGLPFAALRVISDPASRALPALAVDALKPCGNIDPWKVMKGIARNPTAIPSLMSTARDFNRALEGLRGCRGFLFDGLFGDFVTAEATA